MQRIYMSSCILGCLQISIFPNLVLKNVCWSRSVLTKFWQRCGVCPGLNVFGAGFSRFLPVFVPKNHPRKSSKPPLFTDYRSLAVRSFGAVDTSMLRVRNGACQVFWDIHQWKWCENCSLRRSGEWTRLNLISLLISRIWGLKFNTLSTSSWA